MATSTIPAVLTALVATLRDAPALAGVQVTDGPALSLEPECLIVGWDDTGTAVDVLDDESQTRPTPLSSRRNETYQVRCVVSTLSGDTEMQPVRDRAFAIRDAVETVLRWDRTLGGLLLDCEASPGPNVNQAQTADGAAVALPFVITCRGRT